MGSISTTGGLSTRTLRVPIYECGSGYFVSAASPPCTQDWPNYGTGSLQSFHEHSVDSKTHGYVISRCSVPAITAVSTPLGSIHSLGHPHPRGRTAAPAAGQAPSQFFGPVPSGTDCPTFPTEQSSEFEESQDVAEPVLPLLHRRVDRQLRHPYSPSYDPQGSQVSPPMGPTQTDGPLVLALLKPLGPILQTPGTILRLLPFLP